MLDEINTLFGPKKTKINLLDTYFGFFCLSTLNSFFAVWLQLTAVYAAKLWREGNVVQCNTATARTVKGHFKNHLERHTGQQVRASVKGKKNNTILIKNSFPFFCSLPQLNLAH